MTQTQTEITPNNASKSKSLGHAAAVLRVVTGVAFATSASFKLRTGHEGFTEVMTWMINEQWVENSFAFYRPFLDAVVIPNAELFSLLVTWGEAAIGAGFILGFATRATSAFALFISLNIIMASGAIPGAPQADWAFVIAIMTIFATRAGRVWGLDGAILSRFETRPWWSIFQ